MGKEKGSNENCVVKIIDKVFDLHRYLQGVAATSAPIISLRKHCLLQQGSFQPHTVNSLLPCFDTCIYLFVAPLNLVLAGEHSPKVSCRTCMFSLWFRAVKVLQDPNKSCFCVFPSNYMNFHHELVLVITVWILETVRKGGVLIEGSIYCALCQVYPSHIFFQPGSPLH